MTVQFSIFDDKTQSIAKVDKNGALIVTGGNYSQGFYVSVNIADTGFEVIPTRVDQNFVITGMLLSSDRTFASASNAETLTLYEAMASDISTSTKTLFQVDLLKNDRVAATSMNLVTTKGTSLVAIATDTNVDITISGFYINI